MGRDFLVFAVPAEVPESPKALDSLTEGLAPLKPMRGVRHEMRVGPNRIRPTVRAELVPVGPIGASPVVTYHGLEVTKGGCVSDICPVPHFWGGDRGQQVVERDLVYAENWDGGEREGGNIPVLGEGISKVDAPLTPC